MLNVAAHWEKIKIKKVSCEVLHFLCDTEDPCRRSQASRALDLISPTMTVEAGIREILSRCLLLPLQTPSVRGYTGEHEVKRETESGAACEPPYFW